MKKFYLFSIFVILASLTSQAGVFGNRPVVPDEQALQVLTTSGKSALNVETIKLVAWNIYKGKKADFSPDLTNFVNRSDIVLIQEWIKTPLLSNLVTTFENRSSIMAAGFWNRDNFMTGVMTTARANPTSVEWIRSEGVEPFIKTPKMVLMTEYFFPKLGKNILFINIHGLNRTKTDKFARQMEQVQEKIKNYSNPILFGGDFNARNQERTDFLKSWGAKNGFQFVTFPNDTRKKVLDYIMTKGLTVKNAKLHPEIVTSDHQAMEIEVY